MEVVSDLNISIAKLADVNDIMSFIDREWKKDHILSRNEAFFRYEHQQGDRINFVISRNRDQAINGLLGFIPTALEADETDVCTVIWKVEKKNPVPALGIQLLQFLLTVPGLRTVMSVGINEKTVNIYRFLNMFTGTLKQYVLVNPEKKDFVIGKIPDMKNSAPRIPGLGYAMEKILDEENISGFNFDEYHQSIPFKNYNYFKKRYFQHPVYDYQTYGIYVQQKLKGLLVTRIQEYNGARILRIVDFFGEQEHLKHVGALISTLICEKDIEYADFYCYGLDEDLLFEAGFTFVDPASEELIIPNYFSPFQQKNVSIHFFADTPDTDRLRIFKADGDQDRPS